VEISFAKDIGSLDHFYDKLQIWVNIKPSERGKYLNGETRAPAAKRRVRRFFDWGCPNIELKAGRAILVALAFCLRIPHTFASDGGRTADLPYVFLVQNSGWMEPFYSDDRAGKFDPLVVDFITRVAPANGRIVIASFNHDGEVPGRMSPDVVYTGDADAQHVRAALSRVDIAHRVDGRLANSDYHEALINTIKRIINQQSALIFMVTNNKSAPVGNVNMEDSDVVSRTEAFNALLKGSDAVPRVVAWPMPLAVRGRFSENGLVIYGIAYGPSASLPLKHASESAQLRALTVDPPVRLKPLALDPLLLTLTPGRQEKVDWYADSGGGVHVDGIGIGDSVRIFGALTNTHYPYVIRSARLVAYWTPRDAQAATVGAAIAPQTVGNLAPFATLQDVAIDVRVLAAKRKRWLDDKVPVPGTLSITLDGLSLGLAPDFVRKMHALFGEGAAPRPDLPDQLPPQTPKIFLNYANVKQGVTEVPMMLGVHFFPWPLIAVILAALAAIVPLAAAAWYATSEKAFPVMIDGEAVTVALRPFQAKRVRGIRGEFVVSRGFFGSPVVKLNAPVSAKS
jgi:hypothetical protein